MKISHDMLNSIDVEFKNGIMFDIWQEWYQFFQVKKFNWCDINFIQIKFETDRQCGDYEFEFVLLGLGFRIRIPHETEKSQKFMGEIKHEVELVKKWKTVWISDSYFENNKLGFRFAGQTKRPKYFKSYKKCYLQIGD